MIRPLLSLAFCSLMLFSSCSSEEQKTDNSSTDFLSKSDDSETEVEQIEAEPKIEKVRNYPDAIGDCPSNTVLSEFNSTDEYLTVEREYDFTSASIAHASVVLNDSRLNVGISNYTELNADDVNLKDVMKDNINGEEYIIVLKLSHKDGITVGSYKATNDFNLFSVQCRVYTKEEAGNSGRLTTIPLSSGEVKVVSIDKDKICGTFNLTGASTSLKGSFVADATWE